MLERPSDLFDDDGVPRYWFNILPILAEHLEPVPPPRGTDEQMERVSKITVPECLKQEMSQEPWIKIPDELQKKYKWPLNRPRRLVRVRELERHLGTSSEIWAMREFDSPTGSHKVNTALAQAYFAKQAGIKHLVTETGAGQWGLAVAYVAKMFDLDATVFWVKNIMDWKKNRLIAMKNYGAKVISSPSYSTISGGNVLNANPNHPGNLGIAISEGVECALQTENSCYVLGSVLNHVLLHQTIIGLEVIHQLEKHDRRPTHMISCFGGGSNFGGFILPMLGQMLSEGKLDIRFIAYQSQSFPNLVRGVYKYDSPDHAGLLPEQKMYSLGADHQYEGDPIKAGGLQYHGAAPTVSLLKYLGHVEAIALPSDEKEVLKAGRLFADKTNWGLAAAESCYSLAGAINIAQDGEILGKKNIIVVNISGQTDMDTIFQ